MLGVSSVVTLAWRIWFWKFSFSGSGPRNRGWQRLWNQESRSFVVFRRRFQVHPPQSLLGFDGGETKGGFAGLRIGNFRLWRYQKVIRRRSSASGKFLYEWLHCNFPTRWGVSPAFGPWRLRIFSLIQFWQFQSSQDKKKPSLTFTPSFCSISG